MKTRLFIGNLAPSVTEQELRDKFEALFSSDNNGKLQVGNVEVRCKNDNNYFGFVDAHINDEDVSSQAKDTRIPYHLRKHIDLMNNTKWKGNLIKVQPAKESFIEKLRKEQATRQHEDHTSKPIAEFVPKEQAQAQKVSTENSRIIKQADDVLRNMSRAKERRNRNNADTRNFTTSDTECGFEIVRGSEDRKGESLDAHRPMHKNAKQKNKSKNYNSDDDSDEEDEEIKDGIPKFKGISLCNPPGSVAHYAVPVDEVNNRNIEGKIADSDTGKKLISIVSKLKHAEVKPSSKSMETSNLNCTSSSSSTGVNFRKNKQEKSDLLRLQSLEKLNELKTHRKNVIKTSLSIVSATAPNTGQRKAISDDIRDDGGETELLNEPENKKSKMTLFGDDDEDEDDSSTNEYTTEIKVRKQFEGKAGQKLLELKTRWANDDRFKIDERFKEGTGGNEQEEPTEMEKERQMSILTDILGKNFERPTKSAVSKKDSVILPRYDPEADSASVSDEEQTSVQNVPPVSSSGTKSNAPNVEATEKLDVIRFNEPVTYKTVSNLKSLFSADASPKVTNAEDKAKESSFSLLAAFGKPQEDVEIDNEKTSTYSKQGSTGPRSFWQSNPFQYDSSDDEEGDRNVNVQKLKQQSSSASKSVQQFRPKSSFFFKINDPRFEGVKDFFLKDDHEANGSEDANKTVDYAEKRKELKSIVKAKIRNTKRKDEKRTLAIKRAMRKRKEKMQNKKRPPRT